MPLLSALAQPFLVFKTALSACEDYWTWRTHQGEIYEDVVLVKLDPNYVTIRHKFGVDKIRRTDLIQTIQDSLVENFELAEPDEMDGAIDRHDHFMRTMPMAHAK